MVTHWFHKKWLFRGAPISFCGTGWCRWTVPMSGGVNPAVFKTPWQSLHDWYWLAHRDSQFMDYDILWLFMIIPKIYQDIKGTSRTPELIINQQGCLLHFHCSVPACSSLDILDDAVEDLPWPRFFGQLPSVVVSSMAGKKWPIS